MIDKEKIEQTLKEFSFPRLSGTKSEMGAFQAAKEKIEDLGLFPQIQEFTFSTFYSRVYSKLSAFLLFWLMFIIFLNISVLITILNSLVIVGIFIPLLIITRNPEKIKFGKTFKSHNIYLKLKPNNDEKYKSDKQFTKESFNDNGRGDVLFLCHLDSKSQKLTINLRVLSVKAYSYSLIALTTLIIIRTIIVRELVFLINLLGLICIVILAIATFLIIINFSGNKSNGAIDNASGIAIVFGLLNYYFNRETRPKKYNLWFVFTGAEETGTMGIRNFYNSNNSFDKKSSLVFNFDSIGRNIDAFGKLSNSYSHKKFNKLFRQEALKADITYQLSRISIGIHSDGVFLLGNKNYVGAGFGDESVYKYIHSTQDTIDKVNTSTLQKLCEFIVNLLTKIDKNSNYP
ncbi:MAG: M28 family peptidase [Candidatus Lokiarchaeota archaeon]|nr:M28 family peptidase [Candidatus Lokiarchaeota archaeon]MBD3340740.1 M28 family peptidase [Candidatus Lokiarchaeota archaeon]